METLVFSAEGDPVSQPWSLVKDTALGLLLHLWPGTLGEEPRHLVAAVSFHY